MKCSMKLHFIRVFTVCQSTCLGVFGIQRVQTKPGPLASSEDPDEMIQIAAFHHCPPCFMRGPRKFCQRGSNFDKVFFLFDQGRADSSTISRPSSAHQQNAIKWCFAGVPMMTQH